MAGPDLNQVHLAGLKDCAAPEIAAGVRARGWGEPCVPGTQPLPAPQPGVAAHPAVPEPWSCAIWQHLPPCQEGCVAFLRDGGEGNRGIRSESCS